MVTRKIKGGLLVDIGVNVFLPASQVDIRRPHDIGDYIGKTIECLVLKIDEARRNIVVSRRSLIEAERAEKKAELLKQLEVGQLRKGVVKNIADFGAFVDLGGIDGLLHITDMSWGRINHPVGDGQDRRGDRSAWSCTSTTRRKRSPWASSRSQRQPVGERASKYPVGSVVKGTVVNVMSYGAFVKLEDGIEGLVHISEMSWTKRISHPSELVHIDDEIEVVVLRHQQGEAGNLARHEADPVEPVGQGRRPLPAGHAGQGHGPQPHQLRRLHRDRRRHRRPAARQRHVVDPQDQPPERSGREGPGGRVQGAVASIRNAAASRLGLKQLDDDPWATDIPNSYQPGQLVKGKVTKITNFGVFVGLEDGLEGLLHISELADHKVENPEDVVKVGDEIEVKILRVDADERKIGLSRKRVEWAEDDLSDRRSRHGRRERRRQRRAQGRRRLRRSGPLFKTAAASERRGRTGRAGASRSLSLGRSSHATDRRASSMRRTIRRRVIATRRAVFFVTCPNAAHIPRTSTYLAATCRR